MISLCLGQSVDVTCTGQPLTVMISCAGLEKCGVEKLVNVLWEKICRAPHFPEGFCRIAPSSLQLSLVPLHLSLVSLHYDTAEVYQFPPQ